MLLAGIAVGGWELQRASSAQRDRIDVLEDTAATRAEAVDALSGSLDDARDQIEDLGEEPEVPPPEEVIERGPAGPPGSPGKRGRPGPAPTDRQVAEAVESYCQVNGCTGPRGPEPSSLEVAAAVAAYCDPRGECRGDTGPAGESIVGPQGPGPTGEQIAEAVADYCAERDGCVGPAGKDGEDSTVPGPPGPQGEPGPTCPNGADPIEWTVEQRHSVVVGLDPGTYLVCRTQEPTQED